MILENELLKDLDNEVTDKEVEELEINLEDNAFEITNENQADFFLRKIKELQEENDAINSACDLKIKLYNEKVNEFREKNVKQNKNTIEYFTNLLQSYANNVIKENPKKKSIKLPFGTLQYKKQAANFSYTDEQSVVKFLENLNLNQYINVTTKESLKKTELKKNLVVYEDGIFLDGHRIPNTEYIPEEQKFSIKIK